MRPMRKWFFHLPGEAHACGPIGPFTTERKARAWIRGWLGVERLPRGTEVWQA